MNDLWSRCLEKIREEISPQVFDRWFAHTSAIEQNDSRLTVAVRDHFSLETIRSRYWGVVNQAVQEEAGAPLSLILTVSEDGRGAAGGPAAEPAAPRPPAAGPLPPRPDFLNPKYTFDTFVVGTSNEFARACSFRVATAPNTHMNPLFIYGGVGLGKTHLLHAIAHKILDSRPLARIHYTSSENFINELIGSLQRNRMSEFRSKYRKIDALLVDDIQFIAGKERTQEEFFFTFNALHESGKQIIITSDRVPKDTPDLEERLRARFVWGMMVDIGVPDFETKVAILQQKASDQKFPLSYEVAQFIAEKVRSNIRELEGCLIKLAFHASLHNVEIDLPMAQEILKQILRDPSRATTINSIQRAVSDHYKVRVSDLKSKNRSQIFTLPRQIAMYLCRELTRASTTEIGRRFGGKDHTTVIHSTNKVADMLKKDLEFAAFIQRLRDTLESQ